MKVVKVSLILHKRKKYLTIFIGPIAVPMNFVLNFTTITEFPGVSHSLSLFRAFNFSLSHNAILPEVK